ncbi:MAG: SH3 domain-containing protein [Crocinitomicaceae bacterium]|nr:SH3 domain-containing protein [Crocinitomicaceae bacterium]
MKFNQIITLFSLLIALSANAQYDNERIVSPDYEFEDGSTELLYGDNVVFRSGPSASSKAIDTLEIGSEVEIIRKSDEKTSLNGLEWNWYKVKVDGKKGYILGGLIALDHVRRDDVVFLVTAAGVNRDGDDYEYIDYKVRTRMIRADGEYYGHESDLNTNSFFIAASNNRGLDGVDNIFSINLFAEACGVDGGKTYLFDTGERLVEALQLSSVADGGAFWFDESVAFPDDEEGYHEAVVYKREFGESMDEDMNWMKTTIHTLVLKWENDHFAPNIEEFEFGEDD